MSILYLLLAIIVCVSTAVKTGEPSYLGISLGPTYITAVQFTAEQLPVSFTYIKGSQEYQNYQADVLANVGVRIQQWGEWYVRQGASLVPAPPESHNDDRARDIFVGALRNIQEAASKDFQHPLTIATVSRPEHFNNSSAYAVFQALEEVEPTLKQPYQVIRSVQAGRLAYGLNTCEGFGLDSSTCDVDEGPHRVIIVEYGGTYLQVFVADLTAEGVFIENSVRYNDLGENALLDVVADASRKGRNRQRILQDDNSGAATTMIEEKHYAKMEKTISDFLMKFESAADYRFPWWDDVRAVVISGDASESGSQRFRSCVDGALGQHKNMTRDSIDLFYVEAMGAARRGQYQVLNPKFLEWTVSPNIFIEHDEL
ncbi:MAG: hypothetical protein Q9168_002269 [Polycauliona sp. 1 TL-2023]